MIKKIGKKVEDFSPNFSPFHFPASGEIKKNPAESQFHLKQCCLIAQRRHRTHYVFSDRTGRLVFIFLEDFFSIFPRAGFGEKSREKITIKWSNIFSLSPHYGACFGSGFSGGFEHFSEKLLSAQKPTTKTSTVVRGND